MPRIKAITKPKFETGPKCRGCPFQGLPLSQGFVPPGGVTLHTGGPNNEILLGWDPPEPKDVWFFGEAAGAEEVRLAMPFVGGSGQILHKALAEAKSSARQRNSYISNVIKCRPLEQGNDGAAISPYSGDYKNRSSPPEAMQRECHRRYMTDELKQFNGKLIVALGAIPMQWLAGHKGMDKWHGMLTRTKDDKRLMPTWHPAYIMRKYAQKNSFIRDLSRIDFYKTDDLKELDTIYRLHGTDEDLARLDHSMAPSVDIETIKRGLTMSDDYKPERDGAIDPSVGDIGIIGFSDRVGRAFIMPYNNTTKASIADTLGRMPSITGQNLYAFDAYWFLCHGLPVPRNIYDTLAMHHIAYSEAAHDLYSIQSDFAERPEPNWKTKGHYRSNIELVCARDVDMTLRARIGLTKYLYRNGQLDLYEKLVMPLLYTLLQLRFRGGKIDTVLAMKFSLVMRKKIQAYEQLLRKVVGPLFNWRSPKQLGELLYDQLGLPEQRLKGKRTTNKDALEKLYEENPDSKVFRLVMMLRKAGKLDSTYFQLPVDTAGRVHPQLMAHGTATGRLACKEPTIHNTPDGPARQIHVPDDPEHVFVYGDYSSAEYIVLAWYGKEWDLLRRALIDGFDFHRMVAQLFFHIPYDKVTKAQRHRAKFIDFGLLYGRSAKSIALANGILQTEVERNIKQFFAGLTGIYAARQRWVQMAAEKGYNETAFKRRRWFRANEVTKIYNFLPQSTAADVTARAINRLFDAEDGTFRLTPLTVHDSITVQCPRSNVRKTVERLVEIMTLPVPELPARQIGMPKGLQLRVDTMIGENWASYNEKTNPKGLRASAEWIKSN